MGSASRMKIIIIVIFLSQFLERKSTFHFLLHIRNNANTWNYKKIQQPFIEHFSENRINDKSSYQSYLPQLPTIWYKNNNIVKRPNLYYITPNTNFENGNKCFYSSEILYNNIQPQLKKKNTSPIVMSDRSLSARSVIISETRRIKCRRGQVFLYGRCRRRRFFG